MGQECVSDGTADETIQRKHKAKKEQGQPNSTRAEIIPGRLLPRASQCAKALSKSARSPSIFATTVHG